MSKDKKDFILKDNADSANKQNSNAGTKLPEMNFSTFIFSLNSSALVLLGVMDDPSTGKKVTNIPAAKQTIDIITMLEEKTRGNLSKDEAHMLSNILHDLRMLYVKQKN